MRFAINLPNFGTYGDASLLTDLARETEALMHRRNRNLGWPLRLLAEAFNAQDLDACVVLYDPEASVVRLDAFGGTVARGDQGIREVMADYGGLAPHMDVAIHHVTRWR